MRKFSQVWEENWKGVTSLRQEEAASSHRPSVLSTPSHTRASHTRLIIWRPRAGTRHVKLHLEAGCHGLQPAEAAPVPWSRVSPGGLACCCLAASRSRHTPASSE